MSGRFTFDSHTNSDQTGVSPLWVRRVRNGITAGLVTAMSLQSPDVAQAAPSAIQSVGSRISEKIIGDRNAAHPGMSAFDADGGNQTNTDVARAGESNTVLIVTYAVPKGSKNMECFDSHHCGVEIGSGTVIADSDITDKDGIKHGNAIITAGHVIGLEPGVPSPTDPCSMENVRCVAYAEDGRPLGRLTLRTRSAADLKAPDRETAIRNDIVSMNVEPYNDRYDRIQGASLAETLAPGIRKTDAHKIYHSGDGRNTEIGGTPGCSGGGVFDEDGNLSGVATFEMPIHMRHGRPEVYDQDDRKAESVKRNASLANVNMLNVISNLDGQDRMTGIPNHSLGMLGQEIVSNIPFHEHNMLLVTPIGPDILASLGDAGRNSYIGETPGEAERLTVVGNPAGQPLSMEVKSVPEPFMTKDFTMSVDAPIVDFNESKFTNSDGSPIVVPKSIGMSPSF